MTPPPDLSPADVTPDSGTRATVSAEQRVANIAAENAKVAHRRYMREWAKERRAARRMSPPPPGRCARRRPHAAHTATWHGDRQTYCDGRTAALVGSWFVICKVRPNDRPMLVGPFSNEADARAYVTFAQEDTPYSWVVQAQEVDGG